MTETLAAPGGRASFAGLMMGTMAIATFTATALGILATFVIDDLSMGRATLGLVIAAIAIGGGLVSPIAGPLTDALGGRLALAGVYATGALAFFLFALAPAPWLLFIAAIAAAFSQALSNPATNKLIATHLPIGSRGVVTGIKQSGVQIAVFGGGLLLPTIAETFGWRFAMAATASVAALLIPIVVRSVPADRPDVAVTPRTKPPIPPSTWWLGAYGGFLGLAGSVTFFVPLFVEEVLLRSPTIGGAAAALTGLVAFVARIGWARLAEQTDRYRHILLAMAVIAVAGAGSFALATPDAIVLLWFGVVATGASSSAWNSVGMLKVMNDAGAAGAGRASGIVVGMFLLGLGAGPPVFGRIVDVTGSYAWMWIIAIAGGILSAIVMGLWLVVRRS